MYLNQEKYYSSIAESHNNGNANAFINFFLNIILACVKKTTQETTQKKLNSKQLEIIELIKENRYITRCEIAKRINLSEDGVKYNLKKLKDNNIIKRIGSSKGGYWEIGKYY